MKTRILKVTRSALSKKRLELVGKLLEKESVFVFPTDTLYGLGTFSVSRKKIDFIYKLKGRSPRKPLPFLIDSSRTARRWARWGKRAQRLADAFWPGPLTLVLKPNARGQKLVPGLPGIGLRVPDFPMLQDLIRRQEKPLASTSANRSNEDPGRTPARAIEPFRSKIALALAAGHLPGTASTVVDLTGRDVRVLREGAISSSAIRSLL